MVVVLATEGTGAGVRVVVAPMTIRPPRADDPVVEVPAAVRRHLGLGDERRWIVGSEVNHFIWPGPDVRPARREANVSPYHGKIPARLLEQVRASFRRVGPRGPRMTPRDE